MRELTSDATYSTHQQSMEVNKRLLTNSWNLFSPPSAFPWRDREMYFKNAVILRCVSLRRSVFGAIVHCTLRMRLYCAVFRADISVWRDRALYFKNAVILRCVSRRRSVLLNIDCRLVDPRYFIGENCKCIECPLGFPECCSLLSDIPLYAYLVVRSLGLHKHFIQGSVRLPVYPIRNYRRRHA